MTIPGSPITDPEIFETAEITVGCDGGGGPLGHPLVYLNLLPDGRVECPYCSRIYVLKAGAKGGH